MPERRRSPHCHKRPAKKPTTTVHRERLFCQCVVAVPLLMVATGVQEMSKPSPTRQVGSLPGSPRQLLLVKFAFREPTRLLSPPELRGTVRNTRQ